MGFKDILLVLTTYPDPTPVSAVDEPIAFAVAVGSRISAIACEVKFRAPPNILAGALLDVPAMVAAETKKSSSNAEKLLVAFQSSAEKLGVFQERIVEHCLTSEAPDVRVDHIWLGTPRTNHAARTQACRAIRTQYGGRCLGFQPSRGQSHR